MVSSVSSAVPKSVQFSCVFLVGASGATQVNSIAPDCTAHCDMVRKSNHRIETMQAHSASDHGITHVVCFRIAMAACPLCLYVHRQYDKPCQRRSVADVMMRSRPGANAFSMPAICCMNYVCGTAIVVEGSRHRRVCPFHSRR